ncbi:MAG: HAD hydrolase family protein [Phycisphaerae bacterium]|nr:HAD hydrolase family protein [Phycisphaerae bacterium]
MDYSNIKLLVLDVDGVLSDGRIFMGASGEEVKAFNVKDGSGVKYWQRCGGLVAWITGRESTLVANRAKELGISVLHQGCKVKLPVYQDVLAELNVAPEQVAVIGDDLPDIPMLMRCGFSAAPRDAVEEVRERVDYICTAAGGEGCVREVVELILKKTGKWDQVMERYLAPENKD